MKISSKNLEKLLNVFNNYHGQNDKILNCLDLDNGDDINIVLLQVINNLIKEDNVINNINSVNNILDYVSNNLLDNNNIDRNSLNRILTKILESINTVLIEEKYEDYNKKEYRTKYYHLSRKIMKLPTSKTENNKYLEIFWAIITKVKNTEYINKSLEILNIDNTVFKDSHTIMMELISLYIEKVKELEVDYEEVKYYNSVIKLILFNKYFRISEVEKQWCINALNKEIESLSKYDYAFINIDFLNDILHSLNYSYDSSKMLYDLSMRYDIDVENSNSDIEFNIDKRLTRRVVANDYIISIDSHDTKEIDDCLSCEKMEDGSYLVGIHIVDLFGYIDINDFVVTNALSRCETLYLNDIVIYMLPKDLAVDKLSFVENKPRYADSHYFVIQEDGTITSDVMMKTIITNNRKTTYDEVNKVLNENKDNTSLFNTTINNLKKVERIIERKVLNNYKTEETKNKQTSISNKIVSYLMMLENAYIAKKFNDNNYPLIYRIDDRNNLTLDNIDILDEKTKIELDDILYQLQKDNKKVMYGTCGVHDSLGFSCYCHSTSPLRRFADLWNRYLISTINNNIDDKKLEQLKIDTEKIVSIINNTLDRHEYFSIEYNKKIKQLK